MDMTKRARFHIFYTLRYLRYGLLLCLVPMVRALIVFDLPALFLALWQGLSILLLCAAAAAYLWWFTGFWVADGCVLIERGLVLRHCSTYKKESIAVLDLQRPLYCRLFGAARLTLYFKNYAAPKKVLLYLPNKAAQRVANVLMPVREGASVFAPTGFDRLALTMLSANVLTTALFVYVGAQRVSELLGEDLRVLFERAQQNFARFESFFAQFLPAGLAMMTALLFGLASVTFLHAFFQTAGLRVCRNGGVIICRGGVLTKTERRIAVQSISACDVRVTPAARLLGRYPLYVQAGSFAGGDFPLMVYKRSSPHTPEALLTGFRTPDAPLCEPARKSIWQYIGLPCACLALTLALCGVAFAVLPAVLPVLCVPLVLSIGCLAQSFEGYCKEGVCKNKNRTLALWYTRFFTRHEVCVFTPDVSYTVFQSPFGLNQGYASFTLHLPGGARLRARGISQ
ncbi:MAG: PH domain-containing protein [Ruthenibacterium sp.]